MNNDEGSSQLQKYCDQTCNCLLVHCGHSSDNLSVPHKKLGASGAHVAGISGLVLRQCSVIISQAPLFTVYQVLPGNWDGDTGAN